MSWTVSSRWSQPSQRLPYFGERVTARAVLAAGLIFSGLALATWGEQTAGRQLGTAFRPPSEGV